MQLVVGPLAGRLGARLGFRITLAIGTALSTIAFLVLALAHTHPWQFIVGGAFLGAGISFAFASMANLIVAAVPQSDVGIATGINTIMRTVGGAFGAAVATAILTADTLGGSPVPTEHAYTIAFLVSAGGGAAGARRRALRARAARPGRRRRGARPRERGAGREGEPSSPARRSWPARRAPAP